MFKKVLIANRGAIACRIIRTLRALEIESIAVYTEADRASRHVGEADQAYWIGEGSPLGTYLDGGRIIETACAAGAEAIHPGYGFLSENAAFAERCEAAGLAFIGPTPSQLRQFGLKHTARALARAAGVPLLPGTDLLPDVATACAAAVTIGYPIMLKSTAGGGGIGMRLCRDMDELASAFETVQRLSQKSFADGGLYLERYVVEARHIEVQIFGDGRGEVISLGERDCSLQRRHQKVVEETPAPRLAPDTRAALSAHALALAQAVCYRSAGTVEFVVDAASGEFYFLEVNTRLQVEHGVTEVVTGIDLVAWMVQLAANALPGLSTLRPIFTGHAIQARLYAEDAAKDFQPSAGELSNVQWPAAIRPDVRPDIRIDTWIEAGITVSSHYDPLLAKVIAHGPDRATALASLQTALAATRIDGIETNLEYLRAALALPAFAAGRHTVGTLREFAYAPHTVDVLTPGTETTVQDYPGRVGYWSIGVPPSGPMDDYSFRLGNRLLGNSPDAPGLEFSINGPRLRFNRAAWICLTGAAMAATVDGQAIAWWTPLIIPAGGILAIGALQHAGARAYLTVQGGFDVPRYLGSAATFTLGRFGGHGGRPLRVGDVLRIRQVATSIPTDANLACATPLATRCELRVIYGPHGAPDFFTPHDIATFFETHWEVHYHSSRTGVRLLGPKPGWARVDGGEAGLHPSNLHDNAYAIGAVDFTGDMPVILGPDGPSLGGFVCPVTVIAADRWKIGQLRAGDKIQFVPVDQHTANRLERAQTQAIDTLTQMTDPWTPSVLCPPVLSARDPPLHPVGVVYRPAGDQYLLIEYGPQVLDIDLRFRVHALMSLMSQLTGQIPGILELTPGIRSLQVHYDPQRLSLEDLLAALEAFEARLDAAPAMRVPSRIVHLPLAWDDPSTQFAIAKYTQVVRNDAPWCPSNIEFIRRINGLDSVDAVRDIVYSATYLVLGLGDVYLGAPVATPLDPRHRLVTTKYNPARTWTPENAVGIGGSYLCIYGMEGPGGYQFVGRTLQMWNRHRSTPAFTQPWLLRFFDQIRFFPVSAEELTTIRRDFPLGRYALRIEDSEFDLSAYNAFLASERTSIAAFKARQQAAFAAERARWQVADAAQLSAAAERSLTFDAALEPLAESMVLAAHQHAVVSHVHGNVWQIKVESGQQIAIGDTLAIIEAMKMEIAVVAEAGGRIVRLCSAPGTPVVPGQPLMIVAADAPP